MSQPSGICPVCQKPLLKGEDIVTCPSCGAQYHRACYQQAGDCVFKDKHGAGFEYKAAPSKEEPASSKNEGGVLCANCKTVNDAQNIFCESCGQPLHTESRAFAGGAGAPLPGGLFAGPGVGWGYGPQRQYTGTVDDIPAGEWAEFIGNSAPVYLSRLTAMERQKTKVSFFFSAFFLSPMYFAYRKMWLWAALSLVASVLFVLPQIFLAASVQGLAVPFGLSAGTWEIMTIVADWLDIGVRLALGMFALPLFSRFAAKKMRALRENTPDDAAYHDALVRKGGTSVPGVLLMMGLLVGAAMLGYWLAGDYMTAYMASLYPGLFG